MKDKILLLLAGLAAFFGIKSKLQEKEIEGLEDENSALKQEKEIKENLKQRYEKHRKEADAKKLKNDGKDWDGPDGI